MLDLSLLQLLLTMLRCGEKTEILSLAITAGQCMNKVSISKVTKEFNPDDSNVSNGVFDETVSISMW